MALESNVALCLATWQQIYYIYVCVCCWEHVNRLQHGSVHDPSPRTDMTSYFKGNSDVCAKRPFVLDPLDFVFSSAHMICTERKHYLQTGMCVCVCLLSVSHTDHTLSKIKTKGLLAS